MAASILIAEDDFGFRDTLEDVLAEEGYEVATARNGAEALGMLHRLARPALILLDLQMPLMDGVGFLNHLRERPDRDGYEVVIMSAAVDVRWFERAPGVIRALAKPFDIWEILGLLKDFTYRRRSRLRTEASKGDEHAS